MSQGEEDKPYSNREIRQFNTNILDALDRIEKSGANQLRRIDRLENWRSYMVGAISVIAVIGGSALTVLIKKIFGI